MTQPEINPAAGDDIYIKGKKIGPSDYQNLAAFFGEKEVDPSLWNDMLLEAAQSEDTPLRRLLLAIVLDDPSTHAAQKKNSELYFRAKMLVHEMKHRTGKAGGFVWGLQAFWLVVNHGLRSTRLLIVLSLVFMLAGIVLCIYYDIKYPEDGRFFRGMSILKMFEK